MDGTPPEVQAVLDSLGITTSYGQNGNPLYTIDLLHQRCAPASSAIFEPQTKRWLCTASEYSKITCDEDFAIPPTPNLAKWASGKVQPASSLLLASPRKRKLTGDWTETLVDSDYVQFLKSIEWAATPLGAIRDWPISLQFATHLLLADPHPLCLLWGPDRVAIYNEPCIELMAKAHPSFLGRPSRLEFPELWPIVQPIYDRCQQSRMPVHLPEMESALERKGYKEEGWFDTAFIPIFCPETGHVDGIFHSAYEITRQKLTDRRAKALNQISATPDFRKVSVWQHILDGLRPLERDVPLAILYSTDSVHTSNPSQLQLEGMLGLRDGHHAAPMNIDLHQEGNGGFVPSLREASIKCTSILVKSHGEPLPAFLQHDSQWRGFGEDPSTILVIPLIAAGRMSGYLIAGMNPRREYDEDMQQFVQELERLLSAAISSSRTFEEAQAREAKLFKELTATEKFVGHMADISPAGLYVISNDGVVTWANAKYYEITGLSQEQGAQSMQFMDCILEDDHAMGIEAFESAIAHQRPHSTEIRLKRKWTTSADAVGELAGDGHAWMLASAVPNIENGKVTSLMGCLTEITSLKRAQQVEANAAAAAREAKQLQERFIDITSHEMRNPLSAIVQCADSITSYIESSQRADIREGAATQILEDIADAARTILLCAAHQKLIVDDILTVSKLDSAMLSVSNALTEPYNVVKNSLQMFDAELSAFKIKKQLTLDSSYQENATSAVFCDPVRLSQVCVNLLNNAIKFTKAAPNRRIHVRVGASRTAPPNNVEGSPKWFPTNKARKNSNDEGDHVFVTFTVEDTGRGITDEEMACLFNRFAQANARTHIQYGGSGLGLFISRELVELMGGMIGVSSIHGGGSTFAFYIKARRPTAVELQSLPFDANIRDTRQSPPGGISVTKVAHVVKASEKPLQILLVEDNVVNQKVLATQLRRLGSTVHVANNGIEALEFIRTTRFWANNDGEGLDLSVILMDQEMPVMDGLACTREIRRMGEAGLITTHMHIVAVTANARKEQIEIIMAAGVDDFMAKPFKVPDLLKKIEHL